jgi:hypothetical protein
MDKASKYGRVTTAKAYADFTGHPKEFQDKLLFAAGIEPIHAPSKISGGRRQSSADMHMVIDMFLEAIDHEDVDTFILMTGDADFVRMVATLRRRFGRKVIISGVQSTSTSLDLMNAGDARDPITKADCDMTGELGRMTRPLVTRAEDVARAIVAAVRALNRSKPVMTVFLSARGTPEELRSADANVPSYAFPETAAIALARAARYREWRERPETGAPLFENIRRDEAAAVVATALSRGDGWLDAEETAALLSCYGLPLIAQRFAATTKDAGAAAEEMSGEVALKAIAPGVIHKTEVGAVRLHLLGAEQVRTAAGEMSEQLKRQGQSPTGFVVQRMAQKGVEMLVGVVHDPQFGPVVACGAGGVQVELLRDVSVRLTPLSKEDASEMIRSLKTYPLLTGFRGAPVCDVAALEEGLLRVSAMVEDIPQIAELDCNPFVVHEKGAVILDARVRVTAVEPRPLLGVRR